MMLERVRSLVSACCSFEHQTFAVILKKAIFIKIFVLSLPISMSIQICKQMR